MIGLRYIPELLYFLCGQEPGRVGTRDVLEHGHVTCYRGSVSYRVSNKNGPLFVPKHKEIVPMGL